MVEPYYDWILNNECDRLFKKSLKKKIMKLTIIGNGSFGSFLKELLSPHFELTNNAENVILAVPLSAYESVSKENSNKHLINVCSVQKPSTEICLRFGSIVTSIHPLFGRRTPADKRNSILTYTGMDDDTWNSGHDCQSEFLKTFEKVSRIYRHSDFTLGTLFTPETHDRLMAKTHIAAVMAAKQLQVYVERAKDIPDELIPNSFRLMREFVKTLDDMPQGTIESIMANPYF
jgi:prephenate dehydrogenase